MHSLTEMPQAGHYGAIYADPPWNFVTRSAKGRGRCPDGQGHYQVMDLDAIKALPVVQLAAPDCVLLLWITDPLLERGLDVIRAWGFVYKTVAFTWVKTTKSGGWHISLGYWTRGNPEQCLLFTKGHPKALSHSVRQLVVSPRREHSRKPDECYGHIETLVGGPYVELFARHRRPGWDAWGDQLRDAA